MSGPIRWPRPTRVHRASSIAVAAALVVAIGVAPLAQAATAGSSQDRGAQVQAMLDRVLGPGRSVVEIAETVRTGTARVTTVRYGAALPATSAVSAWSDAAGSGVATSGAAAVDSTSTALVVPAGGLVRQTVAVAIDRTALGATPVARVKRLIAAAASIVPSRGDRLTVVVTRFAPVHAVVAPQQPWTAALLPLAVPATWAGGVVLALLILVLALGGRRRRVLPRS